MNSPRLISNVAAYLQDKFKCVGAILPKRYIACPIVTDPYPFISLPSDLLKYRRTHRIIIKNIIKSY